MAARMQAAALYPLAAIVLTPRAAAALITAGLGLLYAGHRLTNSTPKEG